MGPLLDPGHHRYTSAIYLLLRSVAPVSAETNQSSHYLKLSFDLFEQLQVAASSWDLAFRQLGPAEQPYQLEQIAGDRLVYNRSAFFSRFHQKGGSPVGYRTFTLLASGSREFRWCGEMINSDELLVMPESGEFESMSPPGLDAFHLSLEKSLLQEVANEKFDCDLSELLGRERIFCPHGGENVQRLRYLLRILSRRLSPGQGVSATLMTADIESEVAYLCLATLNGKTARPRGARNRRMRALSSALTLLEDTRGRISVPELLDGTGVSRRTLENAFQDVLAVSPAAYIKALRLQRLRFELLHASTSSVSVGQLGRRHGFVHGGQLATDYYALFGESPGATLRG